jgi:hypothetical protein
VRVVLKSKDRIGISGRATVWLEDNQGKRYPPSCLKGNLQQDLDNGKAEFPLQVMISSHPPISFRLGFEIIYKNPSDGQIFTEVFFSNPFFAMSHSIKP